MVFNQLRDKRDWIHGDNRRMRGLRKLVASWLLLCATSLGGPAFAQDQNRDRIQDRLQDQTPDQDRTRDRLQDQTPDQDRDRTRDRLNDGTGTPSSSISSGAGAGAQNQNRDQSPAQTQYGPNNVYGWQLMTAQERATYQNQMRAATTQEERDRIQAQHRKEMQQRAQQRNMTLPDMSGTRGGMGVGSMRGMGRGGRP